MGSSLFNLFFSFRARIVLFVMLVLFATILVLFFINRHSEGRIASLVADHNRDTSLAVDLAQTSFPSGTYIYNLIQQDGRLRVGLDESHIIHRILIAAEDGRVIDSSERADIGQPIQQVLGDLTPSPFPKPAPTATTDGRKPEQVLAYPVETEKGRRRVVIIISPHRLDEIVREEERERWIAISVLSLLLLITVSIASWRFTRPVKELMGAARRVSAGDFDFSVTIKRRDEMGSLARTFNEMLAGLRAKQDLEEKLQRAERSALTGRIAAGVAHEIRNPLSFINLSIDYMRDKFAPMAEVARDDYTRLIDNIKGEIARLNQMVSDFLSFGRPARLKLRELDARQLIEDVINLVRAKAEQQGVSLSVIEKPGDDSQTYDTRFQGDAEQLKTCFSNLAINAVQAMPEGGALAITLRPQRSHIRFEIVDTGHGIAPEALEHIFEPYFSTKETGIGLGLPLTRKLIEDHSGRIAVTSEIGMGTTFTVVLPREPLGDNLQAEALAQLAPQSG
jgi:signal transduction histidine kinase